MALRFSRNGVSVGFPFLVPFFFSCMIFFMGEALMQAPSPGSTNSSDLKFGFSEVALDATKNFELHKAFNMPTCSRYLLEGNVHRFWCLKTDPPAWRSAVGNPRSEIRMRGLEYSNGTWQFEGYGYVPEETTGVCIMQVFGAVGHPTTLMIKFSDCSLFYYDIFMRSGLCDTWFKLNVIHDADVGTLAIYVDDQPVKQVGNRTNTLHWFQFGVYAQVNYSTYMEACWRDVKVLKKD